MLIDTGATVTLISNDLFKKMENPLITAMNREILSANGSVLQVTGKTIRGRYLCIHQRSRYSRHKR